MNNLYEVSYTTLDENQPKLLYVVADDMISAVKKSREAVKGKIILYEITLKTGLSENETKLIL